MTSPAQINSRFFSLINQEVARVRQARRILPADVIETSILPAHEKRLEKLVTWRDMQLGRVSGFSADPTLVSGQYRRIQGYVRGFAAVPGKVSAAFRQAYNAQAATINATYKAALVSNKDQYNSTMAQLKALLKNQLVGATKQQRQAYQQAYNAGAAATKQALDKANSDALAARQTALSNLTTQLTAYLSGTTTYIPPTTVNPVGGPIAAPILPGDIQNIGMGYTYSPSAGNYFDPNGNPVSYQQMEQTLAQANANQVAPTGGGYNDGSVSYQSPPDYPPYQDSSILVSDQGAGNWGWGWSFVDNPGPPINSSALTPAYAPPPSVSPDTISPVPDSSYGQPDVFADSGGGSLYGWGFGSFAGEGRGREPRRYGSSMRELSAWSDDGSPRVPVRRGSSMADLSANPMANGSNTICAINRMGCLPVSTYGFSQWAQIVSAVAQAGAQIGSTVLAGNIAKRNQPKVTNVAPVVAAAPGGGITSNEILWGGGALAGVVVLFLLLRRRR